MSRFENFVIREVAPSDLDIFFQHSLDPEAIRMAAFVNRRDRAAFGAHWDKILHSPGITQRTLVVDEHVAGYIGCFPQDGHMEVTYWLGREYWGKGLATEALRRMLGLVLERPIFAQAATDNIGSIRVLQKCGFKIVGNSRGFAHGRGEDTEEYILRLDT